MCSLSASPLPTPNAKRPSSSTAEVAAAWASTAGWMRTVGQVTAVVTCSRSVAAASAPMTRPHERALALLVDPRVVVVGDPDPVEARRLGELGVADELPRSELLAGEEVADAHARSLPAAAPENRGAAADHL